MKPATEAWMEVAEVDYRTARQVWVTSNPIPESACYHAQQSIEKYLKAVLEEAGRPVPRTHDLGVLLTRTVDLVPELERHRAAVEDIVPYAVGLRYPHDPSMFPDLETAAELAVSTMESVRQIVRARVGRMG